MRHFSISLFLTILFFACDSSDTINIRFEVSLDKNLGDKEKVFLTGNLKQLGMWTPDQVKLERIDSKWITTIPFQKGAHLELKFTRGSWDNEAVDKEGKPLGNFYFDAKSDTTLSFQIHDWKDHLHQPFRGQVTGKTILKAFTPDGLQTRDVIVWLPPNYHQDHEAKFPVLYLHDGQNIFDPNTSYMGTDWQVDEVVDSLIRYEIIEPIIMVGINNTSDRSEELSYGKKGEAYQRFLTENLKPYIDQTYRTKSDRENTAIMGSSMGGLASFILGWEHNDLFSKAACLSPAFQYKNEFDYVGPVKKYTGKIKDLDLYIDNGSLGVDHQLQPGIDHMMRVLDEKKQAYFYFHDNGAEHNEPAWAKRVHRPLIQFFKKN